jgi:hypothetical protein
MLATRFRFAALPALVAVLSSTSTASAASTTQTFSFYNSTTECAGATSQNVCTLFRQGMINMETIPDTDATKCSSGKISYTRPNMKCTEGASTPCKSTKLGSQEIKCVDNTGPGPAAPTPAPTAPLPPKFTASFFDPTDTTCSGGGSFAACDDIFWALEDKMPDDWKADECNGDGVAGATGPVGESCEASMYQPCQKLADDAGTPLGYLKTTCTGGASPAGSKKSSSDTPVFIAVGVALVLVGGALAFVKFRSSAKASRAREYAQHTNA